MQIANDFSSRGFRVVFAHCDVRDYDGCAEAFKHAARSSESGCLDVVAREEVIINEISHLDREYGCRIRTRRLCSRTIRHPSVKFSHGLRVRVRARVRNVSCPFLFLFLTFDRGADMMMLCVAMAKLAYEDGSAASAIRASSICTSESTCWLRRLCVRLW